ncbi:MAG: hypothetical protein ACRCX2_22210, partial [Paraclostridium sp.]
SDGVTLYTWIKYADDASGGGISESPLGKKYIGLAHNKLDQTESDDPKLYTWSLIKGDNGVGVKTIITYYARHTSNSSAPTSGWQTTVPILDMNYRYLWSYQHTTYTDNTTSETPKAMVGSYSVDGSPGAGFYRLSMSGFNNVWPSQSTVDSAFFSEFKRYPETDDVLTLYNPADVTIAQTRRKVITGGAWAEAELLVHGDMILRGTIVADRIAAGAISTDKLAAGAITADKISANAITSDKIQANISLSAPTISAVNITSGQLDIGNGVFKVLSNGAMTATSANITGAINATSGTFRGTVSGSRIEGGSIGIGSQFSVDGNGKLTCSGASIGGTLNSVDGVFTGTLQGVNGTFTGTVQAGSIVSGGNISGGQINIPASSPKFIVRDTGDMTCNDAVINGALINQGSLEGTALYIPNKASPKFSVATDGTTTIQSGSTGSRMVIKNDRIEVWEGSVLRVVLGRL